MPGPGKHSDKWDRCVHKVKDKGGAYNPYAVCTSSVDEECQAKLPFEECWLTPPKKESIAPSSSVGAPLTRAGISSLVSSCGFGKKDKK